MNELHKVAVVKVSHGVGATRERMTKPPGYNGANDTSPGLNRNLHQYRDAAPDPAGQLPLRDFAQTRAGYQPESRLLALVRYHVLTPAEVADRGTRWQTERRRIACG